jgi:hypothetical protein
MKHRMILLAAVATTFMVGHARATTVFMPAEAGGNVREPVSINPQASAKPLTLPDAPVSGVATWAVMAAVLGLTGARRNSRGRGHPRKIAQRVAIPGQQHRATDPFL